MKKLRISLKGPPAMRVTKVSIGNDRLCYLLVCNKKIKYKAGRSKIIYIGTTKKGVARVAQSVSAKAENALGMHGVTEFEARIVTCKLRQNVKTWLKLERGLLLVFKDMFGEIPKLNTQGKNMSVRDEFIYFVPSRLKTILEDAG